MLQLRPILSTLRRHRTAALLIVIEIALTCAIVCNSVFLIANRIERLQFGSGLADAELVHLGTRSIGNDGNAVAGTREDLAALRAVPGVKSAAILSTIPFGHQSRNSGVGLVPNQPTPTIQVSMYNGDVGLVSTLGVKMVAGRDFRPDEVVDEDEFDKVDDFPLPAVIVTRAVAERLFPGKDAIGQAIYIFGTSPMRIVGVADRLTSPHPDSGGVRDLYSVILPIRPTFDGGTYVLRTDPAQRDTVLKAAVAALDKVNPHRVAQEHGTFEDLRGDYYKTDLAMVWLLAGVCVALLVVTAFGIVGLASFWVQQRTKMIGTRRALGATRGQILRYFQTENLLLTSAGIALGMLGAFAINQWLMTQYELPRLPAMYLPLGALALWALGQIAVLAPARRAAALPPAHAMRGI
ncbi:ABC transporter permease [Scleromatobacter humisilvae]|uniref:ABC transporter permease n=1 Tax=Scleromatobacter humisilvae TaxID=2897159 RepID=A0A9X1YEG9_9BURK|nr:FtsX-like permease family protein [Scleromatobacter humisilvae]MCK9684102.1 ABC transporter permease [Scleromatobacter humisilvae]